MDRSWVGVVILGVLVVVIMLVVLPMFQARDCEVSDWSPCDPTTNFRQRVILQGPAGSGAACPTQLVEACTPDNPPDAPGCSYTDWTDWSPCPTCTPGSCVPGSTSAGQYRYRFATPSAPGVSCPSNTSVQTRPCQVPICPPVQDCIAQASWSNWSECSVECGGGTQTRYRGVAVPAANGGQECQYEDLVQQQSCNEQPCGPCVYSATPSGWSRCSVPMGVGTQFRTYAPISGVCEGPQVDIQSCTVAPLGSAGCTPPSWAMVDALCAVVGPGGTSTDWPSGVCPMACPWSSASDQNCVYGPWSSWTECTGVCPTGGLSVRTRAVQTPASGNGTPCELAQLQQTRICNTTVSADPDSGVADCGECLMGPWIDVSACPACAEPGTAFKLQTRAILQPGSDCGPTFQSVSCDPFVISCDTCVPCLYGPWPQVSVSSSASLTCDSQMQYFAPQAFLEELPPSCQDSWLGLGGFNELNSFEGAIPGLPADLAQQINAGQSCSCGLAVLPTGSGVGRYVFDGSTWHGENTLSVIDNVSCQPQFAGMAVPSAAAAVVSCTTQVCEYDAVKGLLYQYPTPPTSCIPYVNPGETTGTQPQMILWKGRSLTGAIPAMCSSVMCTVSYRVNAPTCACPSMCPLDAAWCVQETCANGSAIVLHGPVLRESSGNCPPELQCDPAALSLRIPCKATP